MLAKCPDPALPPSSAARLLSLLRKPQPCCCRPPSCAELGHLALWRASAELQESPRDARDQLAWVGRLPPCDGHFPLRPLDLSESRLNSDNEPGWSPSAALRPSLQRGPRQLERLAGAALGRLWASGGREAALGSVALAAVALLRRSGWGKRSESCPPFLDPKPWA